MNQADQYVKGEWWIVNGTPHPLSLSPRRGEGGYVTRNTFQVSFQLIPRYSSLFQRIFFWETRIAPMKANSQPQNPSQPLTLAQWLPKSAMRWMPQVRKSPCEPWSPRRGEGNPVTRLNPQQWTPNDFQSSGLNRLA